MFSFAPPPMLRLSNTKFIYLIAQIISIGWIEFFFKSLIERYFFLIVFIYFIKSSKVIMITTISSTISLAI